MGPLLLHYAVQLVRRLNKAVSKSEKTWSTGCVHVFLSIGLVIQLKFGEVAIATTAVYDDSKVELLVLVLLLELLYSLRAGNPR